MGIANTGVQTIFDKLVKLRLQNGHCFVPFHEIYIKMSVIEPLVDEEVITTELPLNDVIPASSKRKCCVVINRTYIVE